MTTLTPKDALLAEIEKFLERHNMPYRTFGALALNDSAFVKRLRGKRDIKSATIVKVRAWMQSYRPHPRQRAGNARADAA